MRGAEGSAGGWEDLCDVKLEEKEEKDVEVSKETFIAQKWAKLLTKCLKISLKIRKLQLVFRSTGKYLNELVSKECRERLSKVYSLKK